MSGRIPVVSPVSARGTPSTDFLWHYTESRQDKPTTKCDGSRERLRGFATWVRQRPDAIVSLQPMIVKEWLLSVGKRVRDDMALVSLNLQPDHIGFSGID